MFNIEIIINGGVGMKDFLIKYEGIALYEENLIIVKANSMKDAINKFHVNMINSIDMFEEFGECLGGYIQHEYIEYTIKGNKEEFDWDKATEIFIRSEKGFSDKRRFKGLDLDKLVQECLNILSDTSSYYNKISNETKESIFKWMYKDIGTVSLNEIKVLE